MQTRFNMWSIYFMNRPVGNMVASEGCFPLRHHRLPYFCWSKRRIIMSEDHHDHSEAEQNQIGGPVVLALFLFAILITVIYFLS